MDVLVLSALLPVTHYVIAGAVGFLVGLAVSYVLAIRWIFAYRRLRHLPAFEFTVYLVTGVIGLGVNIAALAFAVEIIGTPVMLGKGAAACASFLSNYLMRKRHLFEKNAHGQA